MNSLEIQRRILKNEIAVEHAKRVLEHIDWTVRDSERRTERALEALRRAGYLRDE